MRAPLLALALAACQPAEVVDTGPEETELFCPNLDLSPSRLVFDPGPADGAWTGALEVWDACEDAVVVDLLVGGDPAFSLDDDSVTVPEGERGPVEVTFAPGDIEAHEGLLLLRLHGGDPIYAALEGQAVADWDEDGHASIPAGGGDCADSDPALHPDAEEHCDGVDEDCDGGVDEDPVDGEVFYADRDRDGWGDADTTAVACSAAPGWTSTPGDCDDLSSFVTTAPAGVDCPECAWAHLDPVVCSTIGDLEGAVQVGTDARRWCNISDWLYLPGDSRAMAWDEEQIVTCAVGRARLFVRGIEDLRESEEAPCNAVTSHGGGLLAWTAEGSPLRWYADWEHLIAGDYGATYAVRDVADARFASTGDEILWYRDEPPAVVVHDRASGALLRELPVDVEDPTKVRAISWAPGQVVVLYPSELIRLDAETGEVQSRHELPWEAEGLACEAGVLHAP